MYLFNIFKNALPLDQNWPKLNSISLTIESCSKQFLTHLVKFSCISSSLSLKLDAILNSFFLKVKVEEKLVIKINCGFC